jgi:CDP-diacylglycerol--serine O-phosphatidyltransferase
MNESRSAASFANWPCALTAGSLAGGFLALILTAQGDLRWAAGVVVACGVLDSLDGLLARRLGICSAFGAELDSLADMVAFGVTPALMLYMGVLHEIPVAGVAVSAGFVLCGAWRLARFAVVKDGDHFIGLPIPPAAVIAAGTAAWAPPAALVLAIAAALCLLMISEIPFPTLRTLGHLLLRERTLDDDSAAVMTIELDGPRLSGSSSSPRHD